MVTVLGSRWCPRLIVINTTFVQGPNKNSQRHLERLFPWPGLVQDKGPDVVVHGGRSHHLCPVSYTRTVVLPLLLLPKPRHTGPLCLRGRRGPGTGLRQLVSGDSTTHLSDWRRRWGLGLGDSQTGTPPLKESSSRLASPRGSGGRAGRAREAVPSPRPTWWPGTHSVTNLEPPPHGLENGERKRCVYQCGTECSLSKRVQHTATTQ